MLPRLFLLSLILFCLELGVFLLLLPWTGFWERNYFLIRYPELEVWLLNDYLRGAISGLGLVDVGVGLWYATHFGETVERLLEATPATAPPNSGKPGSGTPESGKPVSRGQTA